MGEWELKSLLNSYFKFSEKLMVVKHRVQAFRLLNQIFEGLNHSQQIIHRDPKPLDILIENEQNVKILSLQSVDNSKSLLKPSPPTSTARSLPILNSGSLNQSLSLPNGMIILQTLLFLLPISSILKFQIQFHQRKVISFGSQISPLLPTPITTTATTTTTTITTTSTTSTTTKTTTTTTTIN
ncbi:hypothetical protein ACTFIU_010607 [Dictyostelium citrinum]